MKYVHECVCDNLQLVFILYEHSARNVMTDGWNQLGARAETQNRVSAKTHVAMAELHRPLRAQYMI